MCKFNTKTGRLETSSLIPKELVKQYKAGKCLDVRINEEQSYCVKSILSALEKHSHAFIKLNTKETDDGILIEAHITLASEQEIVRFYLPE